MPINMDSPTPRKAVPSEEPHGPDVLLDARRRSRVALPLMPEFAIVSTMALIAAPIVLVGGAMLMAIALKVRRTPPTPEVR
jgi:hypothetical protein